MKGLALKHLPQYLGTFLQSLGDAQLCCPSPISAGPPFHQGFLTGLYLSLPRENLQAHHHSLEMPPSSHPDSHSKLNPSIPGCFSNQKNQGTRETGRKETSVFSLPLSTNFQSIVFSPVFPFRSYSHTCTLLEQL